MAVCDCAIDRRAVKRVGKSSAAIDYKLVVFLVCLTILLQYVVIFTYETGETGENNTVLCALLSAANTALYLLIALACGRTTKEKQWLLLALGGGYLVMRTLLAGNGIVSMFNNVELIVAVVLFGRLRLPKRYVKRICVFSVALFLCVVVTSRYDGRWISNRIFDSVYMNRNHFGVLTAVNMYMALTALRKRGRKLRLSYLAVYAAGIGLVIPTTSRTSLVCVVLLALFHIFTVKKKRINAAKFFGFFTVCLALSAFAVVFLAYVLPAIVGENFTLFGRSILSGRETIYTDAFNALKRGWSWLFGRGVLSEFTSTKSILGDIRTNAHNQWLQFILNYGVVYLAFMIYVYLSVFKRIANDRPSTNTAMFVMMQILFFVYFMTESIHYFRSYACLFLVIYLTNYAQNAQITKRPCSVDSHRRKVS